MGIAECKDQFSNPYSIGELPAKCSLALVSGTFRSGRNLPLKCLPDRNREDRAKVKTNLDTTCDRRMFNLMPFLFKIIVK
jgi:hypothetical protein